LSIRAADAKRFLPHAVRKAILRIGLSLARSDFHTYAYNLANAPNQELSLRALSALGFAPKTIVDVGAYEGKWTSMVKEIWPSSNVIMVEPNSEKEPELKKLARDLDATLCADLLGAIDGEEVEFILMETGSSVLNERSNVPRTKHSRVVRTLDAVVGEKKIDFLKIDVQGYELQVLRGARRVLQQTDVILLELSLIDVNEGAHYFTN
jgi:FkbM family methyltransferase